MTSTLIDSPLLLLENASRFLLMWSWQALLLIGLAWLLCRFDRSRRASVRHQIWLFSLSAVALVPLLSFTGGWLPVDIPQSDLMTRMVDLPGAIAPPSIAPSAQPLDSLTVNALDGVTTQKSWSLYAYAGLCMMWLGGMSVSLLKTISQRRRMKRLCRAARSITYEEIGLEGFDAPHAASMSLRLSVEIQSPVLVGLRHPVILLPENITEWTSVAERQAIIRHELAHLRRRDAYVLVFQSLLGAIYFFHPAVRYALRQLNIEREMACDEAVVSSGVNATLYADTLLKVVERTLSPQHKLEAMRFATKKTLERRVNGIMHSAPLNSRCRWMFIALPLALLCLSVWFIGSARAIQVSREEGEIREFLRQVTENEVRRDPETFNRLAAPEFVRIGANGEVWNKEQTLAFGRAPRSSTLLSVQRQDERIRIYGDTAIVTGLGIAQMRNADGREYVVRNLCTFVLVKRGGRWLCVSVQQTRQP